MVASWRRRFWRRSESALGVVLRVSEVLSAELRSAMMLLLGEIWLEKDLLIAMVVLVERMC